MSEGFRTSSREQPGKWASLALTVAVHLGLAAFLVLGVRWQSSPPASLEVELVAAQPSRPAPIEPPKPAPRPEPKPEPRPAPKPEPKPEPPKPEPKPEPPKPAPKPDIATKAPEPKKPEPKKSEPKPEPKPEPKKPEPKPEPKKPEPKPEPPKPVTKPEPKPEPKPPEPPDYLAERLAQERDRIAKETGQAQFERMMREEAARTAAARQGTARDAYVNAIRTKVRGNLIRPPGMQGNPEAVFLVDQLPDGTVLDVRIKRSSGIATVDDAIERAIRRSSPLPLPVEKELFERTLELRVRPLEE